MTEATQKLIHNKQEKSDFSNICGELLIDGQAVEIVSPQSWLQPSAGDYCHSILSVASAKYPYPEISSLGLYSWMIE